ncbi:MAG: hypothetical protein JRG76_16565 [Deltaproteobacteria bacterium]|nr:hypothetical protein [Deltaproteobacteria bacterium]
MLRIVVVIVALAVAALVLDYATGAMIGRKAWLIVAGENWASDGPLLGFAGGALSGPVATPPPDWSFTSDTYVVEIEVRPDDPYSVNLLCASVADRLYVASGSGPDATWVRALRQNPALRLRVGDRIYELQATRVTDSAEIDVYLDAFEEKYGARPQRSEFIPSGAEAEPVAPLFRLSPPAATGRAESSGGVECAASTMTRAEWWLGIQPREPCVSRPFRHRHRARPGRGAQDRIGRRTRAA